MSATQDRYKALGGSASSGSSGKGGSARESKDFDLDLSLNILTG